MKFEIISTTARTVSIELINESCVYPEHNFSIYLNGELAQKSNTNITTIFGLDPDREYEIYVRDNYSSEDSDIRIFKTDYEFITLNVMDFGAKGTGDVYDTGAIQGAIMACPPRGRVLIPEGRYLTSPIFLKSNITIELQEGAILLGSIKREDYPILPGLIKRSDEDSEFYLGSWEGDPLDCFASLITGIGVTDVKIIGKGILDGSGSQGDWWVDPKVKRIAWRPRTVFLRDCSNVLLQGITVQNSPSWTIHPLFCNNVKFINLNIINPSDSPNTDGINPESCSDVDILGVDFSVGDDCIAIKSGKLYLGKRLKTPSKNITIRNCHMKFGHGAIVIGSEMAGGIKNINARKCIFEGTDRGIRIKTRRGRGIDGIINGIYADNIVMKKVLTPFVINCFYFCDPDGKTEYVWTKEKLPVDDRTPSIKNIFYRNIVCHDSEVAAAFFYGLPEKKIENVTLENISIHFSLDAKEGYPAMMSYLDQTVRSGFFIGNAKNVVIKNLATENVIGSVLTCTEVEDLEYNSRRYENVRSEICIE